LIRLLELHHDWELGQLLVLFLDKIIDSFYFCDIFETVKNYQLWVEYIDLFLMIFIKNLSYSEPFTLLYFRVTVELILGILVLIKLLLIGIELSIDQIPVHIMMILDLMKIKLCIISSFRV